MLSLFLFFDLYISSATITCHLFYLYSSHQDIATVDNLERAAVADPKGIRTIGVLTKPDLIGPGGEDEVLAVLHNVRKPLKLG